MVAIIVHGGAGTIRDEARIPKVLEGVREAVMAGWRELKRGSALDAVEEAIKVLEDNPIFNAGTGSVLTIDGRIEMDAAIMRGKTLEAGAVAGIWGVKNPISVARKVMEETDHVLLVGEGAVKFARLMGFPEYDPTTEERRKQWKELKENLRRGEVKHWKKLQKLIEKYPEVLRSTVGAVAFDGEEVVAGTSTGGVFLKMFGRVGDTPIIGAGTYANEVAGASCTGLGEVAIRLSLAKTATDFVRLGMDAQAASNAAISLATRYFGNDTMGIIMVDIRGNVGFAKNTKHMSYAYLKEGMDKPEVGI
ncbi:plant-type l-asparaginase (l-asparagine amidohydrolase) [Pyrococcus sp. NA2]|uniref:isoaspartyl peptidase/L-asparaginase family protein n=1 Tax=Pyrococcus sp. (strain NA2) TaxID=342949 RepID=UPI000209AE69|nr:isoaspartyl peptidase/L-asparaginase family protein [Pyrococcus sp. NA2]AEC51660.1 plant-type l-asparaginase (l-asparagine amidohydrolase) [Pyrococcus sp. NA2]